MKSKIKKSTINIVTLGCSKNLVDSEVLMKQLDAHGVDVIHNSNAFDADTVIINTCGFIKDAKEESINTILQFVNAKGKGRIHNLFVMGCLSQRYRQELEKEIPDVDRYFGVNNLKDIIETLGYDIKDSLLSERLITTPKHYAYLKISEGCDRRCSFCAIPLIRGKHHSKSVEQVITEAQLLIAGGVKELILIAQDLTNYGVDIYHKKKLAYLLEQLSDIDNLKWIRLHYAYPAGFPANILKVMRKKINICNYLDIPFQHISDPVLKKMRRGITCRQTYKLIDYFRNVMPNLTLRTSLMVGHPGEGEKEFDELLRFVQQIKFDRLGVFSYSEEEGTYGAINYSDNVPKNVKEYRVHQLMEMQKEISGIINSGKIGQKYNTLIDRQEGEYYIGRTEADSPEVDNEVLIRSDVPLTIGNFYEVTITGSEEYDLYANLK